MPTVMGINSGGHDTAVAIMNGSSVWAVSEERLTRIKHDKAFPENSINYVLNASDCTFDDLDLVVTVDRKRKDQLNRTKAFFQNNGYKGQFYTISHHDAHAASAFLCSPFADAAILVVDAAGSEAPDEISYARRHYLYCQEDSMFEVQTTYRGTGSNIFRIRPTMATRDHQNGIGYVYEGVSRFLNFGLHGAGKVMGLAPYGGKRELRVNFFENYSGDILSKGNRRSTKDVDSFAQRFLNGHRPRTDEPLPDDYYTEVAYSVQKELEEAMIALSTDLYNITQSDNLCLAGGVGLNSVANKKILERTPFKNIFIQPAASDEGVGLGCALWGMHLVMEVPRCYEMKHAYLGKSYSDSEIQQIAEKYTNINISKCDNICKESASALEQGRIVGWFQGRSEFGPRALGNRSILCNAAKAEMKNVLNAKVKHREGFRPFAPSILEEHAEEYFEIDRLSPFMLLITKVKEDKQAVVPAITHVDGSARLQTVGKVDNPTYYRLINEYYKQTGIPLLLNTSFNLAGEPIVETPEDAIICFLKTNIDILAIGNYFITK